jgi:hypothetical protein
MVTPVTHTSNRLQFPRNLAPNAVRPVVLPKWPIAMAVSDAGLETRRLDTYNVVGRQVQQHFHSQITLIYDYKSTDYLNKFLDFYFEQTIGHWRAFEIPQDYTGIWCMVPKHLHKFYHPYWRFAENQIDLVHQGCSRSAWSVGLVNLKGEDLI